MKYVNYDHLLLSHSKFRVMCEHDYGLRKMCILDGEAEWNEITEVSSVPHCGEKSIFLIKCPVSAKPQQCPTFPPKNNFLANIFFCPY